MEFNLQSSAFLITNSIDKYSDNLYTLLGYPVQTGESDEEPKRAMKTRGLSRSVTKKTNDDDDQDDIDDDGKYIFGYEIVKAKCNQIHTIHVEFGDPTYDEGEEDEEEDEEEEEDGDKGNLTT